MSGGRTVTVRQNSSVSSLSLRRGDDVLGHIGRVGDDTAEWLVKEGDKVTAGKVIAEIETDKATMEVEAVDEGKLSQILVDEGTEGVAVNTPIAVLTVNGETVTPATPSPAPAGVGPANAGPANAEQAPPAETMRAPAKSAAPIPPQAVAPEPDRDWGPTAPMTVREALRDAMAAEMRADKDVFLLGEEVAQYQGAYKISQGLLDEFGPRRVIDTPITEHGFTGMAVGAALNGLRPIVEFMTFNFAMQAMDQIINSAAKTLYMSGGQMGCPIVFRGPNGAASRVAAQHSQCYASWFAHVPGLKVVSPWSSADAKGLLRAAIRDPNPVLVLENEILYGSTGLVPKVDDYVLPIGKARIARAGKDLTIVAYSMGMRYATQATEKLVAEGIDVELIDLRTLRPLDIDTVIASVRKTGRCVTVEEGWPQGSIGATVAAELMEKAFDYLDAPVMRVTGKDVPMPYAANLEKLALPHVDDVIAAAKAVTYRS